MVHNSKTVARLSVNQQVHPNTYDLADIFHQSEIFGRTRGVCDAHAAQSGGFWQGLLMPGHEDDDRIPRGDAARKMRQQTEQLQLKE